LRFTNFNNKLPLQKKIMAKENIVSSNAPAPIGPYSQAIKANGFLFASGQIAINPLTGELVLSEIQSETKQVMSNIAAVLAEAGIDFSAIVKTTIFLSDMSYFAEVNEVYGSYFVAPFPARETVAVKTLPRNVNVEIAVIAIL
jgi:2-iminobutanoate/2-iminopropanoate deaminase